jgi:hypothetical protein
MLRTILIQLALFLTPFLLYALYLVLRKRNPLTGEAWTFGWVAGLAGAGLVLAFVLFTVLSQNAGLQLSGRNTPGETTTPR